MKNIHKRFFSLISYPHLIDLNLHHLGRSTLLPHSASTDNNGVHPVLVSKDLVQGEWLFVDGIADELLDKGVNHD